MDGSLPTSLVKESRVLREALDLGAQLRSARTAAKLSKAKLAQVASVDQGTIDQLEQGRGTVAPLISVMGFLGVEFLGQAGRPLGDWLADVRKGLGLSQQRIASTIRVSKPTIISLERGRGSVGNLRSLLAALHLPLSLVRQHAGIRYATLCSGIEGVSQAWEPLGWKPVFFAENAGFPSEVLRVRYPAVPNLGDVVHLDGAPWRGKVDVLWASTPCTSFSMAGDRQGMEVADGALANEFARICDEIDPDVVVWENVKGALVDERNAFGHLLGRLAGEECSLQPAGTGWTNAGYVSGPSRCLAWRVLDAQYSGLAQRRERLFLVGCRRGGADPRDILFERHGAPRHRATVREGRNVDPHGAGAGIVYVNGDARPKVAVGIANTLKADTGSGGRACILQDGRIRRLTPVECERLMGLADDTTLVRWRGKSAPDTLRWQAIGNSVAVPDVRWIGERIAALVGYTQNRDCAA